MKLETAGSNTEKVPPNPQHSSERLRVTISISRSDSSSRRTFPVRSETTSSDGTPSPRPRSPWQLWCSPTRWGNAPSSRSTFRTSMINSQNS